MIKRIGQLFNALNRLGVRIFLSIWGSLALLVTLTLLIPQFDQRRILSLSEEESAHYEKNLLNRLIIREQIELKRRERNGSPAPLLYQTEQPALNNYRQRQNRGSHRLIVVPNAIEGRYQVIHHLKNDLYIGFIINTISLPYANQQSSGTEMIVGPFHDHRYPGAHLYITGDAPPQSYYFARLFDAPYLFAFLITLICTPIALHLARTVARPINRLQAAADRVAQGDWHPDPSLEEGPFEYRVVGRSFNRMIEALTLAEAEKNRLFANLSHELRTPLTRIKLTNSLLRRKGGAILQRDIARIDENLALIDDRIQSMLSLSKEIILNREKMEQVELKSLLTPLFKEAHFEAHENGKTFHPPHTIPNITLSLQTEFFLSGLENILRNAIYYAKENIWLTLIITPKRGSNREMVITVYDDGKGVSDEELTSLFEAFFRGERDENMSDYGGSGLGLAIAKQMAHLHHGTINATHHPEQGGLAIELRFPIEE